MAKKGHKKKRAPSPVAKKNRYHGAAIAAPVPPSFPDVRREEGHLVPKAIISKKAWSKITEVVDMDTGRECGALLIGNILRDRSSVVRSEQIVFVILIDVRVFGSDIYSFYIGAFLLDLAHDFKTQVIEITSAAKQKGVGVSIVYQREEQLF